jgi:hypothetical protein
MTLPTTIDADRLNETVERGIQAARKHRDQAIVDWGESSPAAIYDMGLIDAYLDIRDRVFKTKDYETAHRRAVGTDDGEKVDE